MRIRYILLFVLIFSAMILAQNYPHATIHEIQFKPDDSLALGLDRSIRVGDTVQVTGVVMIPTVVDPTFDRRPIMWAGARLQTYLRDTSSATIWSSINVVQDDTVSSNITNMDLVDSTMIVTITGVVSEFGGNNTQLNVLRTVPIQFVGSRPFRPAPVEVTIAELNTGTPGVGNLLTGEKYEGQYVVIRNVVTSDRNTTTGVFRINDGLGNQMEIHDQSGFFTKRAHQLRAFDPPIDGTTIQYIRGVIGNHSNPSRYVIRPMLPNDLLIGQSPPTFSNLRRNSGLVTSNQPVEITVTIQDLDQGGSVTSAQLFYRVNSGALTTINLTAGNDNVWSATIPGIPNDSALVDFYVRAQDNDGMVAFSPADTLRNKYFYLVLNRPLNIQDVQYSPFGSGFSAYNNYRVTVSGVVTADTTDLQGDGNQVGRRTYIQNGSGPWSGIWVFGNLADPLIRGQHVTVSGLIREDNSNTRVDSLTQVVVNSSNNPLPEPVLISTRTIATTGTGVPNGFVPAEQWEGVLVKYSNVVVTDVNADGNEGPNGGGNSNFGEIMVADTSNVQTRVELQEGNHQYHNLWVAGLDSIAGNIYIRENDRFTELRGVMFYSFGNYKLVPRKGDDFVGYSTDVESDNNLTPEEYTLSQNYPNPFNPSTVIEYSLPKAGYVKINIYNILGQQVRTLVNMEQNAGRYSVRFNAENLPSGIYFYELRIENYQQSKKMLLIK
jgi:hypothetical protein